MKERPILFSAPMVRAILAGQKTQTRRIVKPIPQMVTDKNIVTWDGDASALMRLFDQVGRSCPYGKTGDRLWVREAWRVPSGLFDSKAPRDIRPDTPIRYETDCANPSGTFNPGKYRPPMFMPRWASRILLEIVSVRVERLNDITEADAISEGAEAYAGGETPWKGVVAPAIVHGYATLWEQINGAGSWAANPWVWVVEFKQVTA